MAWNPGSRLLSHERAQNYSQSIILALKVDTLSIKSMMTEMYQVFKGQSSLAPLDSVIFTLALTYILTNVEGENEPNTATKDLSSLTEEEPDANRKENPKEPKHSTYANIEFIGEKFKKAQDAEHEVLKRKHTKKVKKSLELKKHKYDNYMWTVSNRLKQKKITDIKIHQKPKTVVITVYRGTDGRTFNIHNTFAFGDFGISDLDELREIIP
nr:hypothetical protein [Tanacetum cinerariifolium]